MKKIQIALKEAFAAIGGQAAAARQLGVSPPTVNQWISGKRPVPAERCLEIEKITQKRITCEQLRPDVDWQYLRGVSKKVIAA